jgi:hypothetical protein
MNHAEGIKTMAEQYIDGEIKARKAAAADLLDENLVGRRIETYSIGKALTWAYEAAPWRELLALAEDKGMADALDTVRRRATKKLTEDAESTSTSALTNEAGRLEREGLRLFLSRTTGWADMIREQEAEQAEQAEQAAAEPQAAEAPEETPAPTKTKAPSPAQLAMLKKIETREVLIRELGYGRPAAFSSDGRETLRVVQNCITNGFAECDTSTSLYKGQKVILTAAGRAALAAA